MIEPKSRKSIPKNFSNMSTNYTLAVLVLLIFCFISMYYTMLCTLQLKSLRTELYGTPASSDLLPEDTTVLDVNTFTAQLQRSVRKIIANELANIIRKVKNVKNNEEVREIDSEETMNEASELVLKALALPTTSNINYADNIYGAYIENTEADFVDQGNILNWIGLSTNRNPPEYMLNSDMTPGSCFAFKNNKAIVSIFLTKPIFIEAIGLEHISSHLAPKQATTSAPRFITINGIDANNVEFFIGSFEFENQSHSQVFPVDVSIPCQRIRVHFAGNHGNPEFTCIYRILVYGTPKSEK